MGNCIRQCGQSRAQKQGDLITRAGFGEEMKSTTAKACKDKDGKRVVIRVKVVVTRKEVEQILRHYNSHRSSSRDDVTTDDWQMWFINKLGVGERCCRTTTHQQGDNKEGNWKPDLETIPEAEE